MPCHPRKRRRPERNRHPERPRRMWHPTGGAPTIPRRGATQDDRFWGCPRLPVPHTEPRSPTELSSCAAFATQDDRFGGEWSPPGRCYARSRRATSARSTSGDLAQDCSQRPDFERVMIGNRHVMFAMLLGRQPQMTPGLPRDRVAEGLEPAGQRTPREVSGELHAAMTSSWTR